MIGAKREPPTMVRCAWAESDPLYQSYHDNEWGVPLHDDRKLFELLILEGMQAGLSWITILRKRKNFRKAFNRFDPNIVAHYNERAIKDLLSDEGIIRNRLKIKSAVRNARAFLDVQKELGSFDTFIWGFVNGKQKKNAWKHLKEIPAHTEISDAMSKELRKRGFSFVGSTVCYAFMQSAGLVNDHVTTCFRFREIAKMGQTFSL